MIYEFVICDIKLQNKVSLFIIRTLEISQPSFTSVLYITFDGNELRSLLKSYTEPTCIILFCHISICVLGNNDQRIPDRSNHPKVLYKMLFGKIPQNS